jgi:hypothetical protein
MTGARLRLTPIAWLNGASQGEIIKAGSEVCNLGGIWNQVLVQGNDGTARYLIGGSVFEDLTISGNVVKSAIRLSGCEIAALKVSGNTQVTMSVQDCSLAGLISDNLLTPARTFGHGALGLEINRDKLTGFDPVSELVVAGNVTVAGGNDSPNDVGIRIEGSASKHGVNLWNNVMTAPSSVGLAGNLLGAAKGTKSWGNLYRGARDASDPRSATRELVKEVAFPVFTSTETVSVEIPLEVSRGDRVLIEQVDGQGAGDFQFQAQIEKDGFVKITAHPRGTRQAEKREFKFYFQIW